MVWHETAAARRARAMQVRATPIRLAAPARFGATLNARPRHRGRPGRPVRGSRIAARRDRPSRCSRRDRSPAGGAGRISTANWGCASTTATICCCRETVRPLPISTRSARARRSRCRPSRCSRSSIWAMGCAGCCGRTSAGFRGGCCRESAARRAAMPPITLPCCGCAARTAMPRSPPRCATTCSTIG